MSKSTLQVAKKELADACTMKAAILKAHEIGKEKGVESRTLDTLSREIIKRYDDAVSNMLGAMNLQTNCVRLSATDHWYAVRYMNGYKLSLRVVPVMDEAVNLLSRDGRHQRELTTEELDKVVDQWRHEIAYAFFMSAVMKRAEDLLSEHCPEYKEVVEDVQDSDSEVHQTVKVSSHAGDRWVQRVLGICKEPAAQDYRRSNMAQISKDILDAVGKAELIHTAEDGVRYLFGEDNLMFVQSSDDTIITLYVEDFGFEPEINRSIVLQQANRINTVQTELKSYKEQYDLDQAEYEADLSDIQERLDILLKQMDILTRRSEAITHNRDTSDRELKVREIQLQRESNKLFKKFDC